MANYIGVSLITLLSISCLGHCAVNYIYPQGKTVNEGANVTLSCYFNGNKPPGSSRWTLNGKTAAVDCDVQTQYTEIITPTGDCSPDDSNGFANFSFVIKNVSLDRDNNKWTCQNTGLNENLEIPITVKGNTDVHNGKILYKRYQFITVTAEIGCSYPPGEVLWCLLNSTGVKCSDRNDWAAEVFRANPVIIQETEQCINYTTPGVFEYNSTIQGNITGPASCETYDLYFSLNGMDYKKQMIRISMESNIEDNIHQDSTTPPCSKKPSKVSCPSVLGLRVTIMAAIIYLIILILLTILQEVARRHDGETDEELNQNSEMRNQESTKLSEIQNVSNQNFEKAISNVKPGMKNRACTEIPDISEINEGLDQNLEKANSNLKPEMRNQEGTKLPVKQQLLHFVIFYLLLPVGLCLFLSSTILYMIALIQCEDTTGIHSMFAVIILLFMVTLLLYGWKMLVKKIIGKKPKEVSRQNGILRRRRKIIITGKSSINKGKYHPKLMGL